MSERVDTIPPGYRLLFIAGRGFVVPHEVWAEFKFLHAQVSSLAANCAAYAEKLKAGGRAA